MWRSLLGLSVIILAAIAVLFLVLTPPVNPSTTDRSFVAAMIPHHHLGMRLLDNAAMNSTDVRLRRLTFEMDSYHSTEVQKLEQWSDEWNVARATNFAGDIPEQEFAALTGVEDFDHDTLWLSIMIRHHRGALEIVNVGMTGSIENVQDLARQIFSVQSRQIDEMTELLNELCAEEPSRLGCTRSTGLS